MPDDMPVLEKIDTIANMLDKLADAQGRAKCGYIYIINEFLDSIKKDVLILEEKVKDIENAPCIDINLDQNGEEIQESDE